MHETFNIFVAKLPTWSLTGLINAILHWIVLIPCSRAAQMRLSVSLFSSPFLNHSHSLSTTPILNRSLLHSVSLTNCPCSAFNFHSFNQFSFFSFLLTWAMCFSKLSSAAAVLTRASLLCVAYFDRLHFFSSTQSSTITRPLPPSLFGM